MTRRTFYAAARADVYGFLWTTEKRGFCSTRTERQRNRRTGREGRKGGRGPADGRRAGARTWWLRRIFLLDIRRKICLPRQPFDVVRESRYREIAIRDCALRNLVRSRARSSLPLIAIADSAKFDLSFEEKTRRKNYLHSKNVDTLRLLMTTTMTVEVPRHDWSVNNLFVFRNRADGWRMRIHRRRACSKYKMTWRSGLVNNNRTDTCMYAAHIFIIHIIYINFLVLCCAQGEKKYRRRRDIENKNIVKRGKRDSRARICGKDRGVEDQRRKVGSKSTVLWQEGTRWNLHFLSTMNNSVRDRAVPVARGFEL